MKPLRDLTAFLTRWIDDAASAALSMSGVFWGTKKSVLVEQIDGAFVVRAAREVSEARRSGESLRFVDGRFAEAVDVGSGHVLRGRRSRSSSRRGGSCFERSNSQRRPRAFSRA